MTSNAWVEVILVVGLIVAIVWTIRDRRTGPVVVRTVIPSDVEDAVELWSGIRPHQQ